jgi:hypothetical protein
MIPHMRIRFCLLALALWGSFAGCGDSPAEPAPPPLSVSITNEVRATGYSRLVDGTTVHACNYRVTAVARGGQIGEYAQWLSGTGRYTLRSSGQRSEFTMLASDVVSWFGSDRITAAPVVADRVTWWSGPFRMQVELTYRLPSGEIRAHDFWLYCD